MDEKLRQMEVKYLPKDTHSGAGAVCSQSLHCMVSPVPASSHWALLWTGTLQYPYICLLTQPCEKGTIILLLQTGQIRKWKQRGVFQYHSWCEPGYQAKPSRLALVSTLHSFSGISSWLAVIWTSVLHTAVWLPILMWQGQENLDLDLSPPFRATLTFILKV